MLFRTNQGICPRVFFDLKLQTLKPGTKMFKNLQMYRMLHEVRFNVFYTKGKVNTPTGNFRYIYELDRIDN